jgi:hypothetical protein
LIVDTLIVLPVSDETNKVDAPKIGVMIEEAVKEETLCELIMAVDAVKNTGLKVEVRIEEAVREDN